MVAAPDARADDLPLLTPPERQQLLGTWNQAEADYPVEHCLHEQFAAQAARTPEAIALVCGDERLSYATLDARANQVAPALRARGVGPERIVGLYADRTPVLIVGLLGILKAGGAFLPLDPTAP